MNVWADILLDEFETPLINVDFEKTVWTCTPAEPEFETKTMVGNNLSLSELVDSNTINDGGDINTVYPSAVTISATYADKNYIGIAKPIVITIDSE